MNKKQKGNWGEQQAINFLKKKDFHILHRNYRYGRCEIDLIATQGNLLVFCEVKVRASIKYGYPEATLSAQQIARIHRAATQYQYASQHYQRIRFDIISIRKSEGNWIIEHFEDAF